MLAGDLSRLASMDKRLFQAAEMLVLFCDGLQRRQACVLGAETALDPIGRKEVLEMIESLRGRTTVFFSTHILGDVERVCDSVAILDHGRVLAQAPMSELKARYGRQKIVLGVTDGAEKVTGLIRKQAWTSAAALAADGRIEISVTDVAAAQREIPKLIAAQGTGLVSFEAGEFDLEDVFVDLVGRANS